MKILLYAWLMAALNFLFGVYMFSNYSFETAFGAILVALLLTLGVSVPVVTKLAGG